MSKEWIAILVASIAAIAAMLSAVLNVVRSGKSKYIETVTAHRVRWIEDLRNDFTKFFTSMIDLRGLKEWSAPIPEQRRVYLQAYERMTAIQFKLNNKSELDRQVPRMMLRTIVASKPNTDDLEGCIASLTIAANDLFKEEWEAVKWESAGFGLRAILYFKRIRRWRCYRRKWRHEAFAPMLDAPPS